MPSKSKPKSKPEAPTNLPSPGVLQALQARYAQLNPAYVPRRAGYHAAQGGLYPVGGSGPLYPSATTDLSPRPGEHPLSTVIRIPTTLPDGTQSVAEYRVPVQGPLTEAQSNKQEDELDLVAQRGLGDGLLY